MSLGTYVRASTANPTGWRPWNSRFPNASPLQAPATLSFYQQNTFSLPTTGRGPFLFQPGVPWNSPAAAGGLGQNDLSVSVDPTLLLAGGALLLLAFLLWGGKKTREYKSRRRSRKRQKIQRQISSLEAQLRAVPS